MNSQPTHRYFAYGSNLLTAQVIQRVGGDCLSIPPIRGFLPDYRLAFNLLGECGNVYANVMKGGTGVEGIIYSFSNHALEIMDHLRTDMSERS